MIDNFNIQEGGFQLEKHDVITCKQIPLRNGHSKFGCKLHKLGSVTDKIEQWYLRTAPTFDMGEYEEIVIEDAHTKIRNIYPSGEKEPLIGYRFDLYVGHGCEVEPMGVHNIAKTLKCSGKRRKTFRFFPLYDIGDDLEITYKFGG